MDVCRLFQLPGMPAPGKRAGNDGFISILMKKSATTTFCIGPSSIRTGISCARSVTQPDSGRTTTPNAIATQRRGQKSAWDAKPATGRDPTTSPGLVHNKAGGPSIGQRIAAKACMLASTSEKGLYG